MEVLVEVTEDGRDDWQGEAEGQNELKNVAAKLLEIYIETTPERI